MFGTLLETKAKRGRGALGTAASVAVHAGVVVLALWGTATAHPPAPPRQGPDERPIYTQVDAATTSHDATNAGAGAPGRRVTAPTIVPTDVPVVDVGAPSIPDGVAAPDDTSLVADIGSGGGSAGGRVGDTGVASELVVDEPVRVRDERTPRYPESLRAAGVEGAVTMIFVVDSSGRVVPGSTRVVASTHPLFTDAVLASLRTTRFVPGRIAGRPVSTIVQRSFRFAVEGRP